MAALTGSVPIDVCIVEDDVDQQRLIARLLDSAGFTLGAARDLEHGGELINREHPRVVLCDYELPDGTGVDLCKSLRQAPESSVCYFVLMSASAACDLPVEVLNAGADDYLTKPIDRQELVARVRVGVRMSTMHEQLRRAAITDGLTGLFNHDHFNRLLESEMGRSRRYGHPLAFIMLDMDFFKAINDTFGHLVGNTTLTEVARVLRMHVRDVDLIARFGGEEFAVILPQATSVMAVRVAERIRRALPDSLHVDALCDHVVTASFGIADSDDPRVTCAADLVDLADRALYLAKHRGRNQVACGQELEEGTEFAEAIQTDEIDSLRRRLTTLSVRAKDVYVQSVESLLQALGEKDPFTARHAVNTSFYAGVIAEQMGLSKATVKAVQNAALLHDIGKVGVPDSVLLKRTPLTPLERLVIDQVPLIGTRIVEHLRILESEVQIIRHQREYFDGSGFPASLSGNQIPIGSRILLVADAFDTMTTDRVYRERRPIADTVAELKRCTETQFDPRVVAALGRILDHDPTVFEQRIQDSLQSLQTPTDAWATPTAEICQSDVT